DKEVAKALGITQPETVYIIRSALEAANKEENSEPKNFFPNIANCNISEDISKKLILILTETFTIDYGNLEMQQQIQRFLEKYFGNPKSSNKETIESNKLLATNGNGTTTLKRKGILQEKDKPENLDHYKGITMPVMNLNESGRTMYSRKEYIKKSVRIPSATHRSDKENTQPVGMQLVKGKNILNKQQTDNLQSDNKRFNIKENTSNHTGHTEPNEKSMIDLLCNIINRLEIIESNQKGAKLNLITPEKWEEYRTVLWKKLDGKMQKTWENIETAIIAAAKKTVPYLQNNQIRRINRLAETKINKFPHSREDLEGWLTEAYTWRKALEGKLMTESERVKSAKIKGFGYTVQINKEEKKRLDLEGVAEARHAVLTYTDDITWIASNVKSDERVWHSNVAVNTIEQCKNLDLIFDMQQVKTARGANCRDKVPLWFRKLEELLTDDAESRKTTDVNSGYSSHKRTRRSYTLNTKIKKNRCMISCNKNLIRGVAVGITKRENNWITNFPTTLLKDKPEYHLTPVQEYLLLQLKEIDYAERELVKSQNFTEK
ncbi:11912_t:CDS:10, partial [Gigaspora margarita]